MINFKVKELTHKLFEDLKQQFPEIELVDIVEFGANAKGEIIQPLQG